MDTNSSANLGKNLPTSWLTYYALFCLFCFVGNLIIPNVLSYINIQIEFLNVFTYSSTFPALYGLIGGIIVLNRVDAGRLKIWSSIAKFFFSVWIIGILSTFAAFAIWEGIDYIDSGGPLPYPHGSVAIVIFIVFAVIPFFLWLKINDKASNNLT